MAKQRVHNEWFQPVSRQAYGGKSRCPCGLSKADRVKEGLDPQMYAWGEYSVNRWNTVDYCCQSCFKTRIIPRLVAHATPCGCLFALQPRNGHSLPPWITLEGSGISCAA